MTAQMEPRFPDPPAATAAWPRGRLLLAVSALAFSAAGLCAREAAVGIAPMVVWRNLFGGAALAALILARVGAPWRGLPAFGRWGWATILVSAIATLFYLAAFAFTSVADVAIIYATAPLATALLARVWLGEPLERRTLAGAVLALCGVGITLAGSFGNGTLFGDGLALAMTLAMAATTVLARRAPRLPALVTSCLATLVAAALALPLGWVAGASFAISGPQAAWLAVFGLVTMALALPCYFAGLAEVPAGEAALIGTAELPLAPLWVWLALGEAPSRAALAGGALVALAVVLPFMPRRRQG